MPAAVPTRKTILLTLIAALALAVAFASPAGAASKKTNAKANIPVVGIGDNNWSMFYDDNYRALGLQVARRIVPYDFYRDPIQLGLLDSWLRGAQAAGVTPLISFEHSYTYATKLPSVAEFSESVKYLRANYPWVTNISPWNEANHKSQPTVNNPKRAAEYFNQTRIVCPSCTIVAADVLDQTNMLPWLKKFVKTAKKPKIWGLHTYTDTNRNKPWKKSTTLKFLKATKGDVWLTESGGIVAFNNTYGYDQDRAAASILRTLNLGKKDKRIKRTYLYCWYGPLSGASGFPYVWDSGLVGPDATPRAGYNAVKSWLSANPSARKTP
ncbi:MAG: glycosyl hydrolase [Solirubrobacterales bacterium]